MKILKYQVDAFAEKLFEGNPAAVCPLEEFLDDEILQNIAMEHNLSETAFIVKSDEGYFIRWFTPNSEVELCGHATLASAYVIFEKLGFADDSIRFQTKFRGELSVRKKNELYELDFPSTMTVPSRYDLSDFQSCFNVHIKENYDGITDSILVLESESDVLAAKPDLKKLLQLERRGIIITAESETFDFVSRFFAPKFAVDEDPVTGSAHTLLIPFWSKRLEKKNMVARQVSERGGNLYCTFLGDRVHIAGSARLYSEGEIYL